MEQNTRLPALPGAGALEVYTGVLYEALDFATLSPAAKRRAGRSLRVQSALWGPVGPADRIAPYRLSMGGGAARAWGRWPGCGAVLAGPMAVLAGDGVVVDCRSSTYAAAWSPAGEAARRLLAVRVFTEVAGRRAVVSHLAKHTRGPGGPDPAGAPGTAGDGRGRGSSGGRERPPLRAGRPRAAAATASTCCAEPADAGSLDLPGVRPVRGRSGTRGRWPAAAAAPTARPHDPRPGPAGRGRAPRRAASP